MVVYLVYCTKCSTIEFARHVLHTEHVCSWVSKQSELLRC